MPARAILGSMVEPTSPSEEFPAMYRAILDGILDLERQGKRQEAALIRAEASATYSVAWDERGRRRLIALQRRIDRVMAGAERPRAGGSRFPSLARVLSLGR
jgi:hypothetical protein